MASAACTGAPEGPPTLEVLAPTDGATVCGDPLRIEIEVGNFTLVDPYADEAQVEEGTGHIDLALNGQIVNMTIEPTVEIPVEPGEYQLQATLVSADHSPILPYVGSTLYFTVDPAECAP